MRLRIEDLQLVAIAELFDGIDRANPLEMLLLPACSREISGGNLRNMANALELHRYLTRYGEMVRWG